MVTKSLNQNTRTQIIKDDTFAVQTYNFLRNAILNNEFEEGEVYSQEQISTILKLSRTPVREALIELQKEGYIRFLRGRGFEVLSPTEKELEDILDLRLVIEKAAAGWAAENATELQIRLLKQNIALQKEIIRDASGSEDIQSFLDLDEQFHSLVWDASGNGKIPSITMNLRSQLLRSGHRILQASKNRKTICSEHRRILEAIAARDVAGAKEAMEAHISNTRTRNKKTS
ncbi:MAG: GntR family transcriptional regulator [Lachnospiraceae bacterium]|nr:GntR family transcriptional regulator [Lachnospiraceae bacterium]